VFNAHRLGEDAWLPDDAIMCNAEQVQVDGGEAWQMTHLNFSQKVLHLSLIVLRESRLALRSTLRSSLEASLVQHMCLCEAQISLSAFRAGKDFVAKWAGKFELADLEGPRGEYLRRKYGL
jgi:hypothetical protein